LTLAAIDSFVLNPRTTKVANKGFERT